MPLPQSRSKFDDYFEFLMKWEGEVYENDPHDRGGATKYGIDQRSHPDVNIRSLTRDQAKAIYWEDYWTPVRAEALSWRLAWVLADIAVNNGRHRAVKWLQELAGTVPDGIFGLKTLHAVAAQKQERLVLALLDRREKFYRAIAKGTQAKFLKGWLNRNNALRAAVA